MLARAAAAVAGTNRLIRALIILAHVICADETPIRVGPGPKARKRYLLVACTRLLTYYFLGNRSLATFAAFVFPDLAGVVVVHDRYQNYDAFPGVIHQLCCQHLIRDCQDAAETYPQAIWPGQIADALRGLIHAANQARNKSLPRFPATSPPRSSTTSGTVSWPGCPIFPAAPLISVVPAPMAPTTRDRSEGETPPQDRRRGQTDYSGSSGTSRWRDAGPPQRLPGRLPARKTMYP